MNECTTWAELREELGPEGSSPIPALYELPFTEARGSEEAGDFLLGLILARDEEALTLCHSPEVRLAAADLMLERRFTQGIPELTFFLRDHCFYEGETEEISQRLERMHWIALRPYLGLEEPEMLQTLLRDLFGREAELDEEVEATQLRAVRMVAWATREQVPLTWCRSLRTLADLANEIFELGI